MAQLIIENSFLRADLADETRGRRETEARLQAALSKPAAPKRPTLPHEVSAKHMAFHLDPYWRRESLMKAGGVPRFLRETPNACIDDHSHFRTLVDPDNCPCSCCGEYSGGF